MLSITWVEYCQETMSILLTGAYVPATKRSICMLDQETIWQNRFPFFISWVELYRLVWYDMNIEQATQND